MTTCIILGTLCMTGSSGRIIFFQQFSFQQLKPYGVPVVIGARNWSYSPGTSECNRRIVPDQTRLPDQSFYQNQNSLLVIRQIDNYSPGAVCWGKASPYLHISALSGLNNYIKGPGSATIE